MRTPDVVIGGLFALAVVLLSPEAAAATTIGIRFVADKSLGKDTASATQTERKLAKNIADLNTYFVDSEVAIRAELVRVDFADIEAHDADQILRLMYREESGFERLFSIADEYGADYTFAVVPQLYIRGLQRCGKAYAVNTTPELLASTQRALAVLDVRCDAHTLAHELGHLMGLNHGYKVAECQPGQGHTTAIAPYANGYGVGACDGRPSGDKFGTIMVGGWMKAINGDGRSSLRMFSNPRIRDKRCGQSGVCGDPDSADAARALNENAHLYASHEEPDVHTLEFLDVGLAACLRDAYRFIEIDEMRELSCRGKGIERLDGIARLGALRRIDVSENNINRFPDELAMMAKGKLQHIDVFGNISFDCASLATYADSSIKIRLPDHCNGTNAER